MAIDKQEGELESNKDKRLHYYNIVIIVPPVLDEQDSISSLIKEIGAYAEFIHNIVDTVEPYRAYGLEDVKILDIADLELHFDREEDIAIYFKILGKIISKLKKPLICMSTIGDNMIQDVVLAEETQKAIGVDVALFEVHKPEEVYTTPEAISYIIGAGSARYHIANILENGHKGPLPGTVQILDETPESKDE